MRNWYPFFVELSEMSLLRQTTNLSVDGTIVPFYTFIFHVTSILIVQHLMISLETKHCVNCVEIYQNVLFSARIDIHIDISYEYIKASKNIASGIETNLRCDTFRAFCISLDKTRAK